MARKNAETTATEGAEAKAKRVLGPKNVYLIFKPGTDPAVAQGFKDQIAEVTMNSRAVLKAISGGNMAPFLTYEVKVEHREKGE